MTDLCEYCEKEIVFKNKIANLLENEFNQFQKDYNISNLMNEIRKKAMIIKNQIKNATNEWKKGITWEQLLKFKICYWRFTRLWSN